MKLHHAARTFRRYSYGRAGAIWLSASLIGLGADKLSYEISDRSEHSVEFLHVQQQDINEVGNKNTVLDLGNMYLLGSIGCSLASGYCFYRRSKSDITNIPGVTLK